MKGGQGVVKGRGKNMFGGQAVIHRKHRTATGIAQLSAQHIVGFDVANHPTTAVVVNQCRQNFSGSGTRGAVFTNRHFHATQVGQVVMHMRHDRGFRLRQGFAQHIKIACLLRRQSVDWRYTTVHHELQQGFGLRVEHL